MESNLKPCCLCGYVSCWAGKVHWHGKITKACQQLIPDTVGIVRDSWKAPGSQRHIPVLGAPSRRGKEIHNTEIAYTYSGHTALAQLMLETRIPRRRNGHEIAFLRLARPSARRKKTHRKARCCSQCRTPHSLEKGKCRLTK